MRGLRCQNGARCGLNTSVLTKMPRDCTAGHMPPRVGQSQLCTGTPYMQKNKKTIAKKGVTMTRVNEQKGVPAAIIDNRTGSIPHEYVLENRELVATFAPIAGAFVPLGASAFTPGYDLNPGAQLTFPWLSHIAVGYEKYRFEKLSFELVPRNSTSNSGGYVMCVDYDYDDPVPVNAAQVMINHGAVSGDLFSKKVLVVNCARLNEGLPWRYVESNKRVNDAARLMYAGYWFGAAVGTSVVTACDLYASYKVRLSLPSLHTIDTGLVFNYLTEVTIPAATRAAFPILPNVGGLKAGTIGSEDIPQLGAYVGKAYKLLGSTRGVMDLVAELGTVGDPPSTYAADTTVDAVAFDINGTQVASNVVYDLNQGAQRFTGVRVEADWAVADKLGRAAWTIFLDKLRLAYPQTAFLVPFIYSTAGRVISTASRVGVMHKEL